MSVRGWSARSRTEKFQIVFGVIAMAGAMLNIIHADFIVRIAVLFAAGLIGAGIGYAIARLTDRTL